MINVTSPISPALPHTPPLPPLTPPLPLLQEVEQEAAKDAAAVEAGLENRLRSFGRGFTVLESRVAGELSKDEKLLAAEVEAAERALQKVERELADEAAAEERSLLNSLSRLLHNLGLVK